MGLTVDRAFAFSDDGLLYQITSRPVGNFDQVLEKYAASPTIKLSNAFIFSKDDCIYNVHALVHKDYAILTTKLNHIWMDTTFSIDDKKMLPQFKPSPNYIQRRAKWLPPPNMKLWFTVRAEKGSSSLWDIDWPFLFATGTSPGTYRLPLPNQYDDGRLCLGDEKDNICDKPLYSIFLDAFNLFERSKWNSDQMPNMDKAHDLFVFQTDTGVNFPWINESPNWVRDCEKFSHTTINEAVLA